MLLFVRNECEFYVDNKTQREGGGSLSPLTWDSQNLTAELCQAAELHLLYGNHHDCQHSEQVQLHRAGGRWYASNHQGQGRPCQYRVQS